MTAAATIDRDASIRASRIVIVVVVAASLGSYLWHPVGALAWTLDVVVRAYLHFVAGAMAHEGTHGSLGRTKAQNLWWTRLALLPTTVPAVGFRKTHLAHHRHTNERGADPDAFLNAPQRWQVPLRAVAMPHQWIWWLAKRGELRRADLVEYALTYLALGCVYGGLALVAGPGRVAGGLFGAAILHSFLLWYPFAIRTHEGYSTGHPDARSHDYRGRLAFFFSFGLSLHRVHHARPHLGWLEMLPLVPACSWRDALTFRRDIVPEPRRAA